MNHPRQKRNVFIEFVCLLRSNTNSAKLICIMSNVVFKKIVLLNGPGIQIYYIFKELYTFDSQIPHLQKQTNNLLFRFVY